MTDFPTKIKVGWREYKIIELSAQEAASLNVYGRARTMLMTIEVERTCGDKRAAETLLHEIMHVVYDERAIRTGDDEERIVTCLTEGIASVWQDNPEVFAWLAENLK